MSVFYLPYVRERERAVLAKRLVTQYEPELNRKFSVGSRVSDSTRKGRCHVTHEHMNLLEDLKRAAWASTSPVAGQLNSWEFRKDCLGNLVRYNDYGKRTSPFGWELDFIKPRAPGRRQRIPRTSRRCTGKPMQRRVTRFRWGS